MTPASPGSLLIQLQAEEATRGRICRRGQVIDFLPRCAHGSTIITSRSRAVASKLVDDCDTVIVQPMDKKQALALLQNKVR